MSSPAAEPEFSFVLPAFNEVMNLEPMAQRLIKAGEKVGGSFEVVWVNDGSKDDTEEKLEELSQKDARIRPVHLSRNFGHMAALTAGLEEARATGAVICLDSDGQHPPELIPAMVKRWRAGAEIVQMIRKQTAGESLFKKVTSGGFYAVLNWMSELRLPQGAADFRLLDRQVVDALNELPESARFLRGLVYWIGFRLESVPYKAPKRIGGETKYNARKMMYFALNGITSFTIRPLRLTFILGMIMLLLAAIYAAYILYCRVVGVPLVPGWTSLLLVTLILSGIQLLTLGVTAEYLGRLYIEAKRRPIYVVRKPRRRVKA